MTELLSEINPFATCRVRPGAIPFFFPPGQNTGQLIEELRENGWWGEIVGRHGNGKSTLLTTLLPELCQAGLRPIAFQLHDRERRLPSGWHRKTRCGDVLIIDGFEKMALVRRVWIKRFCRRRRIGLLVSAHKTMGLPELYRTQTTPEMALRVVGHLLKDQTRSVRLIDVAMRLEAHGGNLREFLFGLYDVFESNQRGRICGT